MTFQNVTVSSDTSLLYQLDDGEFDRQLYTVQLCLAAARQRLYDKNTTILNMQRNMGKERHATAQKIQALTLELEAERRMREGMRGASQEGSAHAPQVEQSCNGSQGDASERCETQDEGDENVCELEQGREATTLRERRLDKAALANSLRVDTQSCASLQVVVESVENKLEPGQRKRAKRYRRKDGPLPGP